MDTSGPSGTKSRQHESGTWFLQPGRRRDPEELLAPIDERQCWSTVAVQPTRSASSRLEELLELAHAQAASLHDEPEAARTLGELRAQLGASIVPHKMPMVMAGDIDVKSNRCLVALPSLRSADSIQTVPKRLSEKAKETLRKNAELGVRVAYARKTQGIGANELDRKTGMPGGSTSRLEAGKRTAAISYDLMKSLATALGVDFWWLAEGQGAMKMSQQSEPTLQAAVGITMPSPRDAKVSPPSTHVRRR